MPKKTTTKKKRGKKKTPKTVETLTHDEASRKNIPTAEFQSVMAKEQQQPVRVAYERQPGGAYSAENPDPLAAEKDGRNRDLDPQLVWRGKDEQDWSDLVTHAPPLFIQEKVHPKVLIDDLLRRTQADEKAADPQMDLFADFNGLPDTDVKTEFYQHDANWTNRMILGDSLQVMASLAEREGLRGQVQCIYIDPPYGIRFKSNFQWSTTSPKVNDSDKPDEISREPEQVKAFRDTWRDGIHSYLTYLRDRLTVARDLLSETGSIFVQIGSENEHRVRTLMDEVFGDRNFIVAIAIQKTGSQTGEFIQGNSDTILWWTKDKKAAARKFRPAFLVREGRASEESTLFRQDYSANPLTSDGFRDTTTCSFFFQGCEYHPGPVAHWKITVEDLARVGRAGRIVPQRRQIRFKYFFDDYPVTRLGSFWLDVGGATNKVYVVQTTPKVIERCILMTTDPGDLVLDPTCGSGTTAYVAEKWARRWITTDTSRVALALARARIMGTTYPYFLLADSKEGALRESELTGTDLGDDFHSRRFGESVRQGFVYERVPHVRLGSIAANKEVDVICEKSQPDVAKALADLNAVLNGYESPFNVTTGGRAGKLIDFTAVKGTKVELPSGEEAPANALLEWEVPSEAPEDWPTAAKKPLEAFWEACIARQKEIDASIAAKADFEYLYDKPYENTKKVRVAGPFTVESLSPHRTLHVGADDELVDPLQAPTRTGDDTDFASMILENLKTAGVQQAHKEDKITFSSIAPWPGHFIAAEGRYVEGENGSATEKRAGIFVGPEFGTVSRQDLVAAAREAGDADFDVLIACAFNYEAHASEFSKLGRIPVLKARMNADLHMADDLKNTGKGNLFVIFGEPDIDILDAEDGQVQVKINGVDVFHPSSGEVRSDGAEGIACWFIDTDYNEESFFVRHAYFLGANDPYKSLKTTLKADINEDAWATLNSDTSRPFPKPKGGRIAVKVINHLGDEVMKVFRVE